MFTTFPNQLFMQSVAESGFMHATTQLFATIVSTNAYCTHESLSNGVHHIIVKKICPETVDAYAQILDRIYSDAADDETVRILNDSSAGAMPLAHLITQVRPLLQKNTRPQRTRHALIVSDAREHATFINMLTRALPIPRHRMNYYRADEEMQALDWLLKDN
jgi:hypothetical protein